MQVAIYSPLIGQYLSTREGHKFKRISQRDLQETELFRLTLNDKMEISLPSLGTFRIVLASEQEHLIAFKSTVHNTYLRTHDHSGNPVATSTTIGEYEKFQLLMSK